MEIFIVRISLLGYHCSDFIIPIYPYSASWQNAPNQSTTPKLPSFTSPPIPPATHHLPHHNTMSKDSSHTYLHFASGRIADLFEDFCRDKLPHDDVYVPPHHQPINPEDEDDVIPDQHAAFGIAQAQQKKHEPAWKDLGLGELMSKGPKEGEGAPRRLPR